MWPNQPFVPHSTSAPADYVNATLSSAASYVADEALAPHPLVATLARHRHQIRQARPKFLGRCSSRRSRRILAQLSPDPNITVAFLI